MSPRVVHPHTGGIFACTIPTIFLGQLTPTQLYGGVPSAGKITFSKIGLPAGWSYNALGFDTSTKYLYAVSLDSKSTKYPNAHLIRVNSAAGLTDLGAISSDGDAKLAKQGETAGAFDSSNNFWVTSAGFPTIDEVSVTSTPPKVIKKVAFKPSWLANDITYAAGYMWGMTATASAVFIQRLNLSTGQVTTFPAPAQIPVSGLGGASWTFGNGNLGFQSNTTGEIFEISVANPSSSSPSFTLISHYNGPIAGANDDGASCSPNAVDLGVTMTASPPLVSPGGSVTWTITVTNHGPGVSSGFALQDPLPASIQNVTTSQGTSVCSITGSSVSCAEGQLAIKGTLKLTITGTITSSRPPASVANKVTVIGNEHDPVSSNNSASTNTTVSKGAPTITGTTASNSGNAAGTTFGDSATLAGGATPTGTITFKAYGPADSTCKNSPAATVSTSVTGDGTYNSPAATLGSAGAYQWVATYSGDSYNLSYSSTCGSEPFTVVKASPTMGSSANPASGNAGGSFADDATVSGGASPNGQVTFKLYGAGDSTCSNAAIFTDSEPLSSGSATSASHVISGAGTYQWTASYAGDPNNNAASTTCGSDPVTVGTASVSIATTAQPATGFTGNTFKDKATVSGGSSPGGTVTFNLYGEGDTTCSNAAIETDTEPLSSGTATSAGFVLSVAGTYEWTATYNGDPNNSSVSSQCGSEPVAVSVPLPPTLTATASPATGVKSVTQYGDSATISGGVSPTGSLTFIIYPAADNCANTAMFTSTVPVTGNGTYQSAATTLGIAGNYSWQVSYSGDGSNAAVMTPCTTASEQITVKVAANCGNTWVGPQTGGNWSYAANWSTGKIPIATDVVCIPDLAGGAVVDYDGSNSASNTIKQLISDAPLEVSGGALMISDTNAADVSQLDGLDLVGGTFGSTGTSPTASVTDTGGLSWTGGSFGSPTSENPPPTFQIGTGQIVSIGPSASTLDNWLLKVASPIGVAGTVYMQAAGGIDETGSGAVTLTDNADLYNYSSSGAVTIGANATLTKQSTPGTASINIPVNIAGTVSVPSGELSLGDGSSAPGAQNPFNSGSLTGTNTVATGATLLLDGVSLGAGATDTGQGTTQFESYITVASSVTLATADVTEVNGETFDNGPVNISGLFYVAGGTFDPLIPSGAAADTVGSFSMSGGNLGDATSNTDSFTDNGAFSWTGGSFNSIPTETTPTISVGSSATTTISSPNAYLNNWILSSAGPIGVAGYVYFENAGGISETGTATVTLADGTNMTQSGSSPGFLTIPTGATLTKPDSPGTATASVPMAITGNVTVPDGVMSLGYGAVSGSYNSGSIASAIEVDAGGQLELNGVSLAAGATDTGAGILVFEAYLTIDPSVTLNVDNLYQASGTTIDEGDVSITGNMDVAAGAFIPLNGTFATGTFSVGSFTMTGGTFGSNNASIAGNQTISVDVIDNGSFIWTGGSFETLSVTPQPVFGVAAGQTVEITNPSGYLDNWILETASPIGIVGSVYFSSSGGIDETGTNGTAVTLSDGTNISDQGSAGDLTIGAGAALTKSSTPGTATAGVPVNILGNVTVPLGELALGDSSNVNQSISSTISVAANSALQLTGVSLAAGATNSGAGTLILDNNLTIDKTVTLAVNNVDVIGGTTTDNGPVAISGTFSISAGTFIPNIPPAPQGGSSPTDTVGVFSMTGGQLGNVSATVDKFSDSGGFFWSGGSFHAQPSQSPIPTFTVPSATVTITSPTGYLDDWSLQSPQPIGIAGTVYFSNHGYIDETGTSAVTLADGTTISDQGSAGFLTVGAGASLTKGGTPGFATVGVPVSIAGALSVPNGELILGTGSSSSSGTITSTVSVPTNAELELNSVSLGAGATDSGGGTLILAGTDTIDSSVTLAISNVDQVSGTTTDNGPVAISGALDVSAGTFTPLVPPGGSPPVDSVGSFTMTGGSIGPSGNGAVTTDSINVAGNFFWTAGSFNATGSENPTPQITLTSSSATANITSPNGDLNNWILSTAGRLGIQGNVYFTNHGGIAETGTSTVTIGTGTDISDQGTAGVFSVASGATVTIPNNFSYYQPPTIDVPFDMAGTLQLGTGVLDIQEGLTLEGTSVVDETVGGTLSGINQGLMNLSLTPSIKSGATLDITQGSGFVPTSHETFTVLNDNQTLGTAAFTNTTLPANWTVQYSTSTPGYVKVVAP